MELKIKTIDCALADALKTTGTIGAVHSIYSSVVNIQLKNSQQIFSIALQNVIQSPNMMRTEDIEKFMQLTQLIEVGEPVQLIKTNQLRIGMFVVDWSLSSTWANKLERKEASKAYVRVRLKQLKKELQKAQGNNQLIRALLDEAVEDTDYFQESYKKIINTLKEQITTKQLNKLIGLGIGLTPSGDDFFTGCFAVLYAHNQPLAKEIRNSPYFSIDTLSAQTTTVSLNMILYSFQGKVNQALYTIVMADELALESMQQLQKIGSTSGEDMLAGVYFGYFLLNHTYKEEKDDCKSKNR